MITSDTSIGKIETIREYKRKNSNKIIVLEPIYPNTSELNMLELFADELAIDVNKIKSSRLYKKILNELYSGLIIIVDEFQKIIFYDLPNILHWRIKTRLNFFVQILLSN